MKEERIDILGTEYTIKYVESFEESKDYPHLDDCDGILLSATNTILLRAYLDDVYLKTECDSEVALKNEIKESLRHEIIHAFLNESGLRQCSGEYNRGWARNEEMVDWIAIQFPKIYKVYEKLNILE